MMRRSQPPQPALFAYLVNLEQRIASDHPLRQIKATLDLSFVEPAVAHTYGKTGHPSLPPQILMRMMFLLFYYNIPSERELVDQIRMRLDFLWFLDLDLNDPVPHHSVLSKARARWGEQVFEQLFVRTVQQCVAAGLVNGKLLHLDSTIVAANASKDSVLTSAPELVAALRQSCRQEMAKLDVLSQEVDRRPSSDPQNQAASPSVEPTAADPKPASLEAPSPDNPSQGRDLVPEQGSERQEPFQPTVQSSSSESAILPQEGMAAAEASTGQASSERKKAPVNATHLSLTDPEAELARDKSQFTRPSYKEHRLVDDAHGIITALESTSSNTADGSRLPTLYEQHLINTNLALAEVALAGDKHYGTASNFRYCQEQGLLAHLGEAVNGVEGRGLFGPHRFVYEPESDRFRCPAGRHLVLHQRRPELHCNTYLIEQPDLCLNCPLRPQCTRSKKGRSLQVAEDYELLQKLRQEAHSLVGRANRRRRRHVMEGSFADAANNHGSKRARWRGLWRQRIQSLMIATIQNLRRLIQQVGPGRKAGWAAHQAVKNFLLTVRKVAFCVKNSLKNAGDGKWGFVRSLQHQLDSF